MKHILDSSFRYKPSFDTDVRKTFEKIRRQQQSQEREHANASDAKARAEAGLRYAVSEAYRQTELFADGWHLYGWAAKKAERVPEDE